MEALKKSQKGWISVGAEFLDLLCSNELSKTLTENSINSILVLSGWEELSMSDRSLVLKNIQYHLKEGSNLRIAVQDGFHPELSSKSCLNYRSISEQMQQQGYRVEPLEWCDEKGRFHFQDWDSAKGKVLNSRKYHNKSAYGVMGKNLLIVDAIKTG